MKKNLIIAVYFLVFWIVIPGAILILSITLDRVIFNNQKLQDAFFAPGLILTISGFLLLLIAIYQFKQQSGEYPVLHTPPDHIIRKNIFAIWRHPIYLFASFTLIGASMILRSYSASFILFPSFMLLVCFYIRKEEAILVKRFGRDYIYHKNNVPILIPYLHHWLKIPESLLFKLWFRLKIHNRENIPDSVPFIVISGHRHYFDPRFISYAMNYPLTHISTLEMFRVRIIRKLFIWF